MTNLIKTDANKSGFSIEANGNVLLFGTDYIGSVCQKGAEHFTAYLAIESGEEVLGQFKTQLEAAMAVDAADSERSTEAILELFEED